MKINTQIYSDLLEGFCNDFDRSKIDACIPSIFVPHYLSSYETASRKIFYIGRDTNGWGKISDVFDEYSDKKKIVRGASGP